jgi:hypothetical protein
MKQFIEGLGLDPVLSEHASFPVNPDVGTVDNCLEVVEAKADIFVLIVGGRYGPAAETDKSVTNLEFLKAKAKGVPIYVVVTRSILDILPVWLQNQTGDFSSVSDSPKLFQFVVDIRNTGENWVFPFDTSRDIFDVLRSQLAYLFMDALELRTRMRVSGGLPPRLRNLRGSLLRLVVERPKGWEYILFSSALDEALTDLADLRRDWQYGVATEESVVMTINQRFHLDSGLPVSAEIQKKSYTQPIGSLGFTAEHLNGNWNSCASWCQPNWKNSDRLLVAFATILSLKLRNSAGS